MTDRVFKLLNLLKSRDYKQNRITDEVDISDSLIDVSDALRKPMALKYTLEREHLNAFSDDRIGFNRTYKELPIFRYSSGFIRWQRGNSTPNYGKIISNGLDAIREYVQN